jgi:hypothetical protein
MDAVNQKILNDHIPDSLTVGAEESQ